MKSKAAGVVLVSIFLVTILLSHLILSKVMIMPMSMSAKRESFIGLKGSIQGEMLGQGMYRCCLTTPCTYCIEKTPGHGEEAECSCQEDIYNGEHPCGECIGEILEGHGNPLMSEYFARAIAEKTGEYDAIARIIEEKYGIPLDEQL